ncbi:MAG TPA: hypothetical protein VF637_08380, partial [Sphingomicrobium sp.]
KLGGRAVTIVYAVPSRERAEMTRELFAGAYSKLPAAKLVGIEDSAHFVMLDQPAAFAAAVRAFLAD